MPTSRPLAFVHDMTEPATKFTRVARANPLRGELSAINSSNQLRSEHFVKNAWTLACATLDGRACEALCARRQE